MSGTAIFMAGLDYAALAACLWLMDGHGYQRWSRPFVILGMNAIAVYVASDLAAILLGVLQTSGPEGTMVSLQEFIYRSWCLPLGAPAVVAGAGRLDRQAPPE